MQKQDPFQSLQEAVQSLTQNKSLLAQARPQQNQQQGQDQQGIDANQLYADLIQSANQDIGKYKPASDTNIHPQVLQGQHQITSQATAQAVARGADPSLLDKAAQFLNKNQYIGLCEAFVEHMTKGREGLYKSAIDAWNQQQNKQTDISKANAGDLVYFDADSSNGGYGHTGVYMGNNKFVSATNNGIKQYDLNDWINRTKQKPLGFISKNQFAPQVKQSIPQQQSMQQPVRQAMQQPQQQPFVPSAPLHVRMNQPYPLLAKR